MKRILSAALCAALSVGTVPALAQVAITEVAPWSSGNSPVEADWFELTNTGLAAIGIGGWRMDDSSAVFANSRLMRGVTTLGAGESAIFIEGAATDVEDAALRSAFVTNWFGGTAPAGLQIGFYGGAGIGLSTDGDAVTLFDAGGAVQAKVAFGASPGSSPFGSFDNSAALNDVTIAQLSAVGVNGAFSVTHGVITEIGSPGMIAAVPEPETYVLLLAGLGLVGAVARRRQRR